jgi:outer membrane protein TolC
MRRIRLIVVSQIALLAASAASGAERESTFGDPLEVEPLIAYAREHNPEMRAAEARAAAKASAYDDPTFSYEAWNFPDSFRIDHADNGIFKLAQKLPFPGKRRLAGAMAERDADVARADAAGVGLDVEAQVKRAFYELWLAHENLGVYARDKELAQRFARSAEQRYAAGAGQQADVLRAQVEVIRLINEVSTRTLAIERARAELNAILSRDPRESLAIPAPPAPRSIEKRPDRFIDLALRRRPELAAQDAAIAREEARVRLAHLGSLPDLELSASRFVNHDASDGFGAMVSVSIPIANRGKYAAAVAEADARLSAARAERRRIEDRIRREVAEAHIEVLSAQARHELHVTTHIPQAEQTLRLTENAYQAGAMDFLSVIESFRAIESAHLEHFESAAAIEIAYADLERATGGALDEPGSGESK